MQLKTKQNGFTLLEVLVALVILAIGLLGISRAQLLGFKSNTGTLIKTQAVSDLYTMSDRIRSNSSEAGLGAISTYNTMTPANATKILTCASPPVGCTKSQMAENDLYEWQLKIAELPMGQGTISFSVNHYTISTTWDSDRSGVVDSADTQLSVVVRL